MEQKGQVFGEWVEYATIEIPAWQLLEIEETMRATRGSLLHQTGLDDLKTLREKERKNESALTRRIDSCLGFIEQVKNKETLHYANTDKV